MAEGGLTIRLDNASWTLRRYAREAGGVALAARCAGELRPLRPLTQRTRAVGVRVAVESP